MAYGVLLLHQFPHLLVEILELGDSDRRQCGSGHRYRTLFRVVEAGAEYIDVRHALIGCRNDVPNVHLAPLHVCPGLGQLGLGPDSGRPQLIVP